MDLNTSSSARLRVIPMLLVALGLLWPLPAGSQTDVRIGIQASNATGNYTKIVQRIPVKILVSGDVSKVALLKPGMSAGVTIDTRDKGEEAAASQNAEAH